MRPIDADALTRELKSIKTTFGSGKGLVEGGLEIAISTTNAMPTIGEWIPCSERLPNYRELVLVTTRDLRVNIAYLDTIQENISDVFWSSPLDDWDCALWNITAWMPLPEPWKGEGND